MGKKQEKLLPPGMAEVDREVVAVVPGVAEAEPAVAPPPETKKMADCLF